MALGTRAVAAIRLPAFLELQPGRIKVPKFLIEVPHQGTAQDCARAIEVFFRTGSHFLTHADWGCKDGVHSAWLTIDVATKEEARNVVPAEYRPKAKVVGLNSFTQEDLAAIKRQHLA